MATEALARTSRIAVVDVLRGAAMFGILTVNIWFFASAAYNAGQPVAGNARVGFGIVTLLFMTKSYLLFAFLFGYSFVLQDSGPRFARRMRRRLVGLIVLGLLHAVLLYPGDILVVYGILGFALLAMRGLPPAAAVRRGIILTAVAGVLIGAFGLLAALAGPDPSEIDPQAVQRTWLAYNSGPAAVVGANAATYPVVLVFALLVQGLPALGAMLCGMAAARSGVLRDRAATAAAWRRLAGWGPAVGVVGALAFTVLTMQDTAAAVFVGLGVTALTAPFLTAAYAAAIVAVQQRSPDNVVLRGIGSVGRIALTNYLLQSLAMAVVFTGYGFGLMERLSGLQIWGVIIAIYTVQVVASAAWLRRHRYGPAEWLLRRWTLAGG